MIREEQPATKKEKKNMYPVLRLHSEEETLVLNKISQLRVEIEYLKQLNENIIINYSDAPVWRK